MVNSLIPENNKQPPALTRIISLIQGGTCLSDTVAALTRLAKFLSEHDDIGLPLPQLRSVSASIMRFPPPQSPEDLKKITDNLAKLYRSPYDDGGDHILARIIMENQNISWFETLAIHNPRALSNALLENNTSSRGWIIDPSTPSSNRTTIANFLFNEVWGNSQLKGVPQAKVVLLLNYIQNAAPEVLASTMTPDFFNLTNQNIPQPSEAVERAISNLKRAYLHRLSTSPIITQATSSAPKL